MKTPQLPNDAKATFTRAAARFGIHPGTVKRYVERYEIPTEWLGNRRLVDVEALEKILRQPPDERPR